MPPAVLKTIRFLVPAAMLYLLLAGTCWFSHWCDLAIPTQYDQITKSILALILGYLYSLSYLREIANRKYFEAVNQNLVVQLTAPFRDNVDISQDLSWSRLRPIFYHIVDNDESLKHQATLAYWNGALWTSAADLRAISGLGCVTTAVSLIIARAIMDVQYDYIHAAYFFLLVALLFFLSFGFSTLSTRRHIAIGTEQCETIIAQHRDELREQLARASR